MAAKPMTIPSKYSNYATQNNLFNLFQFMLEELLVAKPDDPLTFLQNILKRPTTNGKLYNISLGIVLFHFSSTKNCCIWSTNIGTTQFG
jgi:hypothetical protein